MLHRRAPRRFEDLSSQEIVDEGTEMPFDRLDLTRHHGGRIREIQDDGGVAGFIGGTPPRDASPRAGSVTSVRAPRLSPSSFVPA